MILFSIGVVVGVVITLGALYLGEYLYDKRLADDQDYWDTLD